MSIEAISAVLVFSAIWVFRVTLDLWKAEKRIVDLERRLLRLELKLPPVPPEAAWPN